MLADGGRELAGRRVKIADLPHRLRELAFGLVEGHPGIGRVELHQRRAGLHEVGVVGGDRDHRAGNLGSDLDDVAVHIGIVGGFGVAERDRPVGAIGDGARGERAGDREEQFLAVHVVQPFTVACDCEFS